MNAAVALRSEVITKAEILELAACESAHAEAQRAATLAEDDVKAHRLALAEKVLGVNAAQLKQLSPDEVQRLADVRLRKHLWSVQRGAPDFTFEESSHGRYPRWKDFFVAEVGEARATQVQNETAVSYSYRIRVEV